MKMKPTVGICLLILLPSAATLSAQVGAFNRDQLIQYTPE